MEIIEQLTDLDAIKVSSHGMRKNYFEPTAAQCSSSTSAPATTAQPAQQPASTSTIHKQHVHLEASTVKGNIQGLAQAELIATLRDVDNEPIAGQEIIFVVSNTREEFGRSVTDANGRATLDTGSNVTNPQLMFASATSGYKAIFKGTREYYPAEAMGRYTVSV